MDTTNEKALERKIREITAKYSCQQYQKVSGDYCFENVPRAIKELWYSDDKGSISLSLADMYLSWCRGGMLSVEKLEAKLTALENAFAREFKLLKDRGKNKSK